MRTWIRFALAPALLAILWTTLPEKCDAQGKGGRGGGGGRAGGGAPVARGGGAPVARGGGAPVARGGGAAVARGGGAVVSGNRGYVAPGNYSRGYYGGGYYGGGRNYGYGGLGYGLAGFGLGYGLGAGLGYGGYGLGGYGLGYGGGGYYGNNYSYGNAAPAPDYQSFYPPDNGPAPALSDNGRGRIVVFAPPNAQVFWNGTPSSLTGPIRSYSTLPLGPQGALQTFEARWTDANGQVVSQTRTVQALPNQSVTVDFNQPAVNQ